MTCFDRFSTDFICFTSLQIFFFLILTPHLSFREEEGRGEEGRPLSTKESTLL